MRIIPFHSVERIKDFMRKHEDTAGRTTTLNTQWDNELTWGRYVLAGIGPRNTIYGIIGFGINEYGNIEPSFTVVHKEFRRRGVASELKYAQEDIGRILGAQRVYTVVRKDNKASQAMLIKCGYFPHREGKDVYYFVKQIGPNREKLPAKIKI